MIVRSERPSSSVAANRIPLKRKRRRRRQRPAAAAPPRRRQRVGLLAGDSAHDAAPNMFNWRDPPG
jgi:hypothetical protein